MYAGREKCEREKQMNQGVLIFCTENLTWILTCKHNHIHWQVILFVWVKSNHEFPPVIWSDSQISWESPLVLQDHQHGCGFRFVALLCHLIQMLHFVCFLSITEVEIWTEINWIHPNLDKINICKSKYLEQTWSDCPFYQKHMSWVIW